MREDENMQKILSDQQHALNNDESLSKTLKTALSVMIEIMFVLIENEEETRDLIEKHQKTKYDEGAHSGI